MSLDCQLNWQFGWLLCVLIFLTSHCCPCIVDSDCYQLIVVNWVVDCCRRWGGGVGKRGGRGPQGSSGPRHGCQLSQASSQHAAPAAPGRCKPGRRPQTAPQPQPGHGPCSEGTQPGRPWVLSQSALCSPDWSVILLLTQFKQYKIIINSSIVKSQKVRNG